MGASNTKPKPITIACYVPKVKGFCRLFTLSRDEWTFEALIKEIRKFYPEFNGMVTAKAGEHYSLITSDFVMKRILEYFERKPDFNNTIHFTLQGIKKGEHFFQLFSKFIFFTETEIPRPSSNGDCLHAASSNNTISTANMDSRSISIPSTSTPAAPVIVKECVTLVTQRWAVTHCHQWDQRFPTVPQEGDTIKIFNQKGEKFDVTIAKMDPELDFVLLKSSVNLSDEVPYAYDGGKDFYLFGYSEINSTKQCKLSMTHGRFSSRNFDDKARYTRRTRGIPVNGIPVSKGYSGGGIFSPPDHLLGICRWPAPTSGQEEYNSFEILPVFEFLHHIPEFAPKLSDSDDEERGF